MHIGNTICMSIPKMVSSARLFFTFLFLESNPENLKHVLGHKDARLGLRS